MAKGPKLFTCPKCRHTYLGHDPLPDCPRCGYDYREKEGFRWDVVVYLLSILALVSFLLVASYYRGGMGMYRGVSAGPAAPERLGTGRDDMGEKLPGERPRPVPSPYQEPGR